MNTGRRQDVRLTAELRFWTRLSARPSKPGASRDEARVMVRELTQGDGYRLAVRRVRHGR